MRADLGSGGTCFLVGGRMSPCRDLPCWRGAEDCLGISFMWLLIHPSMGLYRHGLLTSERPCLPMPALRHRLNKGRSVEAGREWGSPVFPLLWGVLYETPSYPARLSSFLYNGHGRPGEYGQWGADLCWRQSRKRTTCWV